MQFKATRRKKNWIPLLGFTVLLIVFFLGLKQGEDDLVINGYTIISGNVFPGLVIGTFTSIIGSFVFIGFLYLLKPNIVISQQIGFDNKKQKYLFKVINKSHLFPAYDLDLRLYRMNPYGTSRGNNWRLDPLPINEGDITFINSKVGGKEHASYAILFGTSADIKDILEQEACNIMFQISLKHSFSGFSKTYHRYYYDISAIKYGLFEYGDSTKIEV